MPSGTTPPAPDAPDASRPKSDPAAKGTEPGQDREPEKAGDTGAPASEPVTELLAEPGTDAPAEAPATVPEPGDAHLTEAVADPQALGPEPVPPPADAAPAAAASPVGSRAGGGYDALAERSAPRPPSRLAVGLSLLALVVALGVGGAVAGGWLKPMAPPEILAASERLGDLTQRLTRAEQKLAALEERTPLPGGPPAGVTAAAPPSVPAGPDPALLRRIEALEARAAEPAPTPPPDPRVADLEGRMAPLEQQVQSQAQAVPRLDQRLAPVEEELPALDQRVQALTTRLDGMGQTARVQDLDRVQEAMAARIDRLDQALAAQDDRLAVANRGAALARLSAASAGSAPFAPAVAAARAAFGSEAPPDVVAALDAVAPAAEAGAPTLAQLRADWPATLAAIRNAEAPADLGERLAEGLGGLVTIRRTDAGDETGDPVAAAQAALDGGDLRAALAALDRLSGPAAQAAAPWTAGARHRLAVVEATAALQQALARNATESPAGEAAQ